MKERGSVLQSLAPPPVWKKDGFGFSVDLTPRERVLSACFTAPPGFSSSSSSPPFPYLESTFFPNAAPLWGRFTHIYFCSPSEHAQKRSVMSPT